MWKNIALVLVLLVGLSACDSFSRSDLKSPCSGIEGSPCGPRHHVNDWWLS